MNFGSEMVEAKDVSGKNIFWSTLIAKNRGEGGKYIVLRNHQLNGTVKPGNQAAFYGAC